MRVVALFRVSTVRQENEGASLDAQQRRYRELASANGWTTAAEFRGQESAAKAASERAVLQAALARIREGDVEALWVYEQSRLTRGDELEVALLTRELRERGVAVVVGGSAPRRLDDITDSFAFGVQSLVDRSEALRIRERMMRGRREKATQGRKTGGAAPYGYVNPPPGDPRRGQLQIHEEEARVVRRIFVDVAGGASLRSLVDKLNRESVAAPRGGRWGKTTLRRILDNPAYIGTQYCSAWVPLEPGSRTFRLDPDNPRAIVVEGAHAPIVSPELRQRALDQVRGVSTGRPGMLTGLLWIGGERVVIDRSRGRSFYRPAKVSGPWIRVEDVNRLVWAGFGALVARPAALGRLVAAASTGGGLETVEDEALALERAAAKLRARLDRLVLMRSDGEITRAIYDQHHAAAQRQLRDVERALREIRQRAKAGRPDDLERAVKAVRALARTSRLSPEQQCRVVRSLVTRVDVQVAATGPTPKDGKGRYKAAPRWRVEDVFLRLHRGTGPDTTAASCGRPWVTVQVVAGGAVVERLRREHVAWRAA